MVPFTFIKAKNKREAISASADHTVPSCVTDVSSSGSAWQTVTSAARQRACAEKQPDPNSPRPPSAQLMGVGVQLHREPRVFMPYPRRDHRHRHTPTSASVWRRCAVLRAA